MQNKYCSEVYHNIGLLKYQARSKDSLQPKIAYRNYKIIFSYGQLSVINSINLHIYCCVSIVSIYHASCTWPNKGVCPVFDQKTHCFQSYIQGYRKTGNK